MRICRFNDDRLGIVAKGLVLDVTVIQEQIKTSAPYTMKGDLVVKALHWRHREQRI